MAAQAKIVARMEVQVERVLEIDDGVNKVFNYMFKFTGPDRSDTNCDPGLTGTNEELWGGNPNGDFRLRQMLTKLPLVPLKKYHIDISEIEDQDLPF